MRGISFWWMSIAFPTRIFDLKNSGWVYLLVDEYIFCTIGISMRIPMDECIFYVDEFHLLFSLKFQCAKTADTYIFLWVSIVFALRSQWENQWMNRFVCVGEYLFFHWNCNEKKQWMSRFVWMRMNRFPHSGWLYLFMRMVISSFLIDVSMRRMADEYIFFADE